jgi:hypothetical protein
MIYHPKGHAVINLVAPGGAGMRMVLSNLSRAGRPKLFKFTNSGE